MVFALQYVQSANSAVSVAFIEHTALFWGFELINEKFRTVIIIGYPLLYK